MGFLRTGTCSRCGECCGYPRSSDGGQNNPWPVEWPDGIRSWSQESIQTNLPILQFVDDMVNIPNGNVTIRGTRCYWIWVAGHGLCTDAPPYGDPATYDQRCPLLGAKQPDNTVPCLVVGTRYQNIYDQLCTWFPPLRMATQADIDYWNNNCPSCSYTWTPE